MESCWPSDTGLRLGSAAGLAPWPAPPYGLAGVPGGVATMNATGHGWLWLLPWMMRRESAPHSHSL